MSAPLSTARNCLRVGYRPGPVWRGRGASGLEDSRTLRVGRDGSAGLDRGKRQACDQGAVAVDSAAAPITQNQALSGAAAGQVARAKSHRLGAMADFCAFRPCCPLMASSATPAQVEPIGTPAARLAGDGQGGAVPPFGRARTPYPGRAGQTQDPEKSARGRPCASGSTIPARSKARNLQPAPTGSGVRANGDLSGSARQTRRGGKSGSGFGAVEAAHFQSDRGKDATLGRARA